ncbi:LCP family protein [Kitasatospora sp. NPDC059648]|uniref:LCP family protein n=1 Tax=Kitasatospora sp. NPDC059648 TaxID=3346894 RepID=UPI00369C6AE1
MTEHYSPHSEPSGGPLPPPAPGPSRRRRILRRALLGAVVVMVGAVGSGSWAYFHLNGNLHHAPLNLGPATQTREQKDRAGHNSMNILVIGSDTRSTAADCLMLNVGIDCSAGANADTEMLVHLSADRTDATVLSIPRDTVVDIPSCTDPKSGRVYPAMPQTPITASLQNGGPGCTVAAVHALTGITIDHFVMSDFAGAVAMTDAVGGVQICVDNNIYDPHSSLKLTKGAHTLKGLAAMEFLHTRYGFGDGSDLGRVEAQHAYLTALIQKLRTSDMLSNPVTLYHLLNTATRALTVDDGLAGLSQLGSLAARLNEVSPSRTVFLTMPNVPYPSNNNWVSPAPSAAAVFRKVIEDRPLTTARSSADLVTPTAFLSATSAGPSSPRTAADPPGCIPVSTQDTTPLGSPIHAYAMKPDIPNSAP